MKKKHFALSADQIRPLIDDDLGCFATDQVTVDNQGVGFMYREEPDFEDDSGWRFFSGLETEEYLNDPENCGIYEVNTIANYDESVIPLLDAQIGSAYQWNEESQEFELIPDDV